ncbi:MAG: hypothetical protein Q9166_006026 [cf. Caloplaca sp. 2 TL-2023]
MGLFDDIFDDLCPSSLRIPPLQDPFPFPTITDKRPSPLEPNARTNSNIDKEAAKLTGRGKALAEAKPIGESENNELRPIHSTPRKRQKKYDAKPVPDFVQLPRPKSRVQDDSPRPFLPISVLNALHEPPPSAALFPPITPSANQVERDQRLSEGSLSDPAVAENHKEHGNKPSVKEVQDSTESPKRLYLRKRTKWSEEETYSLVQGVDKFGVGKWTKILNHTDFYFSEGRNAIDLKDRFRTIMGNVPAQPPKGVSYQQFLGYADGVRNTGLEHHSQKDEPQQPRRKPKHLWSEEEDESLVKGYQKYGFSWKDIATDPTLALMTRTGPQIRDRFRKRFPELYGEAPAPSKDSQITVPEATAVPISKTNDKRPDAASQDKGVNDQKEIGNNQKAQNRKLTPSHAKHIASASAPHDINGLLNSDDGQNRQTSFRSDGWGENVTLAPLLWEDLCAKPMFELD